MSAYLDQQGRRFGVEPICDAVGGCVSTYYARRVREPSARTVRDAELVEQIRQAREGYRRVYGIRKTWRELRRRGITDVGRERVGRVMRHQGWHGVRRGRPRTTRRGEAAADRARDLVNREFTATAPNHLWVADLTYVPITGGYCYLAFILDAYSRRIVGWQLARHMRTSLVMDALEMAAGLRDLRAGLVAHTDHGGQYTSLAYTTRLAELGIAPSLGSVGDALDNAMAESWVATYKTELVAGDVYPSYEHAEHATLSWIGFYNHDRLHEALGDIPPVEYEALHATNRPESEHQAHRAEDRRPQRPSQALAGGGEAPTLTRTGPFGPAEAVRPALP